MGSFRSAEVRPAVDALVMVEICSAAAVDRLVSDVEVSIDEHVE